MKALAWLPRVLLAVAVALAGAPIVWYWLDPAMGLSMYLMSVLLGHVAAIGALGIALALVWKGWHAASAPALGLFLLAFGLYNGSVALIRAFRVLFPSAGGAVYEVLLGAAIGGGLGALVRFSALFPVPPGANQLRNPTGTVWQPILTRLHTMSASSQLVLLVASIVAAVLVVDALFVQPSSFVGPRHSMIQLVMVAGFAVASLNLWVTYTGLGEVDRAKVFWVAEGVLLLALGVTLPLGLRLSIGVLGGEFPLAAEWYIVAASEIGFVSCLGFAVFGRGAVDSSLLFRRTTLAGGITILALFLFSGIENVVTDLIVARLGLPGAVGTWVAGGCVALILTPLYRWVEKRRKLADSSHTASAT